MRSVFFKITKFPTIKEIRKKADRARGKKIPLTIEVTLEPESGGAVFIVDVDVEMMNTDLLHKEGVPRGQTMPNGTTSRGGRNSWKWAGTTHVYGSTKFPGFRKGKTETTIDLEFNHATNSGKFEAKIDDTQAA